MLGLANMSGTWDLGFGTPCEPALKMWKILSKWEVVIICCVGCLCEGVHSHQ